jgi:pimeloyl-ACP methyl ester carboxylesterase
MTRRKSRRRLSPFALGAALAAALTFAPAAAHADQAPWRQDDLNVQVAVEVDGVGSSTIHATRYTPTKRIRGVQILVPGVTYDHRYYDLKTAGGMVSQARDAARNGWITIAVDRLGTGGSSKPRATSVTTAAQVASLDHFVDTIDKTYKKLPIVLVGHSYGSVVAEGVAARSDHVDALVVTGFMYRQSWPSLEGFPELVLAADDPVLGNKKLPANYLTTAPDSRDFFYYLPNAKKSTLIADEKAKSTTTAAESPGFTEELTTGYFAKKVKAPVLVVVGEYDFLYKGSDTTAFATQQKQAFSSAHSVTPVTIPDAAHDLALQENARRTTDLIDQWALMTTR